MYQALYRKWRPRNFEDVVGQSHITDTLKRQIEADRLSHAYLFTGTRGTGKTTCAKILARAVNCEHPVQGNPCNACPSCLGIENGSILDVLELDAASNNGVDQVRALRDEAIYTPAAVKKRVYIIDEVHMLSTAAFNALLKILEEPPAHLMFILATTELHKVPATIKSRCQQFSFQRILPGDIANRLRFVAREEGIPLSDSAAVLLARLADGGLRDALSLLDQCAGMASLEEQDVLDVLGLAGNQETARLLDLIAEGNTSGVLERVGVLYQGGKDMGALLGELSALVRDLLIQKTAPTGGEALLTGGYEQAQLTALGQKLAAAELVQMMTILQNTAAELYRSSNRRTEVELCVIRLSEKKLSTNLEGLVARLSRLEAQMEAGVPMHIVEQPVKPSPPIEPLKRVEQDEAPLAGAEASDSAEALPPWEEEPPVVSENVAPPWEASPTEQAVPNPSRDEEKPPHAPKTDQQAEATQKAVPVSGESWAGFTATLRGKIPPAAYSFISKSTFAMGQFEAGALNIWADSEMIRGVLEKPDVLRALQQLAQTYTGRPLRVSVRVGKPEEKQAEPQKEIKQEDKLNDLLALGRQFGNITIK